MFILQLFKNPQYFVYVVVIVVFSICFHEFAHAVTAYWQGDATAKKLGYFTLNPMVHMGKVSIICLLLTGLSWGLCPVNPNNFKHKYSDVLVSFAGPFSNLVLACIFAFLLVLVNVCFNSEYVIIHNLMDFLELASFENAILFVFNMIPIPPLDGSNVFSYFIPKLKSFYENIGARGIFILIAIFFICPPLSKAMSWLALIIFSIFVKLFVTIFSLFG